MRLFRGPCGLVAAAAAGSLLVQTVAAGEACCASEKEDPASSAAEQVSSAATKVQASAAAAVEAAEQLLTSSVSSPAISLFENAKAALECHVCKVGKARRLLPVCRERLPGTAVKHDVNLSAILVGASELLPPARMATFHVSALAAPKKHGEPVLSLVRNPPPPRCRYDSCFAVFPESHTLRHLLIFDPCYSRRS